MGEAERSADVRRALFASPSAAVVRTHRRDGERPAAAKLTQRARRWRALDVGGARLRWMDTPHLPHGWDAGLIYDEAGGTLFCGDLFTQGGKSHAPVTESDILGPSEAFRGPLDYFAHSASTRTQLERLAALKPQTLACMHGSAWCGDGAGLLRELAGRVG
jgi:flavorubredoxin